MQPLCIVKNVPSVLFTIRAGHMRSHRGEVSFPGGKRDPTDNSILETALREMEEEIFIKADQIEVLGEYATMPNKGCTLKVHPFVGIINTPFNDFEEDGDVSLATSQDAVRPIGLSSVIQFNPDEVSKVFAVPIDDLMDPAKRSMVRFRSSNILYPVWKIDKEDIDIWGLTAFILDGVLRTIARDGQKDASVVPKGTTVDG
ncbi:nudix (nucleoside diphosphate linked moiety X)-type motif 8, partial [Podila epigama]